METFPLYVLFENLCHDFPFTLKEMFRLKLVSKDFRKQLSEPFVSKTAISKNLSELVTTSSGYAKDKDFIDIVVNSDICLIELERMLRVWDQMKTRKYGEKYGFLFKHHLIKKRNPSIETSINTLYVLNCMYILACTFMKSQQHAPTDLARYVIFWISDYLKHTLKAKHPHIPWDAVISFADLYKNSKDYIPTMDAAKLYECVAYAFCHENTYVHLASGLLAKDVDSFQKCLAMWMHIYNALQIYNNPSIQDKIVYFIMSYIYNSLHHIQIETLPITLAHVIKNKTSDLFHSISEDTDDNVRKNLRDVCTSLLAMYAI